MKRGLFSRTRTVRTTGKRWDLLSYSSHKSLINTSSCQIKPFPAGAGFPQSSTVVFQCVACGETNYLKD